jgi:hypothetical protein
MPGDPMKESKSSTKSKRKRDKGATRSGDLVLSGQVPGQELEKAAADVSREAGKSLLRGIERLFGARFGHWLAENEAKAEAARMAISTGAAIDRSRALTGERRRQELEEIQHQETRALAQRRLRRLMMEMAREEANFEAIAARSLKQIEHNPDGDKKREIDDDWMFKFARYAQDVSDKEVQELWARILTSSAIEGALRISAASLQAMSLIDKTAATDFEKFCAVYKTLRCYPVHQRSYSPYEPQSINLRTLQELGLIESIRLSRYSFPEFDIQLGFNLEYQLVDLQHDSMQFTQRGTELANALFRSQEQKKHLWISDELRMKYFQDVISTNLEREGDAVNILPKVNGSYISYAIRLSKRTSQPLPGTNAGYPKDRDLPDQLQGLIEWADENYVLSRFEPLNRSSPSASGQTPGSGPSIPGRSSTA